MRQYVVHTGLDNSDRAEVMEWCQHNLCADTWRLVSNYQRDKGTFDLWFNDRQEVVVFMLRWGGAIVEVIDTTDTGYKVNYHALFQEETI